ncbi:MAG TPA: hypothetical protein VEG08_02030 [Terriglobales bacterium]|nr:hypothetical protein [Terriglobales bacterium]
MRARFVLLVVVLLAALPGAPQEAPITRDQTRELLRSSLERYGPLSDVNISFHQSEKQPYNFVGIMTTGLKNSQELEVVVGVSDKSTISVHVYPHYNSHYINVDKARDPSGLMLHLLHMNHDHFFYWGADDDHDVFAGYTFTLESGYPDEAIRIVLRSIRANDDYVGELRPYIDGSAAAQ